MLESNHNSNQTQVLSSSMYSPQYDYVIIVSCAGIIYTAKSCCYWIRNSLYKERMETEEKIEINVDIKEGQINRGKIKDRRM
jgi:hypothetical protein